MRHWKARCSIILLLLMLVATQRTGAQVGNEASRMVVHVTDTSGNPLWLARTTIYGKKVLISLSSRSGDAVFLDLLPGMYRVRVVRYGYTTMLLNDVELGDGTSVTVSVKMAKEGLRQIASVAVKAGPRASIQRTESDSVPAEVTHSLVAGLQSVPGLTVGSNGQASFQGYSASQTTVSINGVPVSIPGSPSNLQVFNADLFSSASVVPQPGGGGRIDFETQSPTLEWQGVARAVLSEHNGEDLAIQESGTAGQVGVSFTHASNTLSNPLDGLSYLDTSGKFYSHQASDMVDANALQSRYEFSPYNTVVASAISIDATHPLICVAWTGVLPCGYGPTNVQQTHLQTYQLRDVALIGHSPQSLALYSNVYTDDLNQSGYYVNGVHTPADSLALSHDTGVLAKSHIRLGQFLLPLNLSADTVVTSSRGDAFGSLLPAYLARYSSESASTSIPVLSRPRLGANVNFGIRHNDASDARITSANEGIDVTYSPSHADKVIALLSAGMLSMPSAGFNGVSSPALLQFNCSGDLAYGTGPRSASPGGSQTQTSVDWIHNATRWSSEIDAYYNVQYKSQITGLVSGASLDPALFGANYFNEVDQAQKLECGTVHQLTLSNLFFLLNGIASKAVYDGVSAAATYDLSEATNLTANYALTSARAFGADPLLFNSRSTIIAGHQLPNVPLYSANIGLKTLIGDHMVGLFEANYSSANNAYNLPGYMTLNAGVLVSLQRGLFMISVTNLTNRYPGPFATAVNAVPLPLSTGSLATIATPLAPRTFAIGYRLHVGQPERAASFSVPNEQFQPASASGLAIQIPGVVPFLVDAPSDWFLIDRQKTACGPKDVSPAEAVLNAWHDYVQRIQRASSRSQYPDTFQPLDFGAIQFNYHKYRSSYVVVITPAPNATTEEFWAQFQPVQNCATIYGGSEQQLQFRHLYDYPADTPRYLNVLPLYSPEVGMYHEAYTFSSPISSLPTPQNITGVSQLRRPSPQLAFVVRDDPGCSPEVRPAAEDFLHEVQMYAHAYFDLHQNPPNPPGMLINTHANGVKSWLSIRTEDLQSMGVLEQCINIIPASHAALEARGFDGEPPPQLNYSPLLGYYLSR
jgi:hypothetical protein